MKLSLEKSVQNYELYNLTNSWFVAIVGFNTHFELLFLKTGNNCSCREKNVFSVVCWIE